MSETTEIVQISKKRLEILERSHRELQALEDAGVDNWEGHSIAMYKLYGDEE